MHNVHNLISVSPGCPQWEHEDDREHMLPLFVLVVNLLRQPGVAKVLPMPAFEEEVGREGLKSCRENQVSVRLISLELSIGTWLTSVK